MKIKFLITGLVSFVSVSTVFAQKGELTNAQDQYNKYDGIRGQKALASQANAALTEAKASIDKAAANEKTAKLPLTYAIKGAIYSTLALNDTVTSTSTPLFITADESLKSAKEADSKGENKKIIDAAYRNLAQYKFNKAYKFYNSGNYAGAYEAFDYYRSVFPEDTSAVYYTALAATNAKKFDAALGNYQNLVKTKFSKRELVYGDMVSIYLIKKDTAGAIKTIGEAIQAFPNSSALTNREITLYLQTGKAKELGDKLDRAIANDPKNKTLYYFSGYINLQQKIYDKARAQFEKALAIDPDYYDANLSMGLSYLNPGIDIFNKANTMPISKTNPKASQAQYDALSKQAVAIFDQAKPYLEKAAASNPKSEDALDALKKVYLGKKDPVNANAVQKKLDALRGK